MNLEKIQKWLDETKDELIVNYDRLNLRASGEWERQLETEISETNFSFRAKILGAKHTGIMVSGRKPNKNQNPASLRAWVGWAGSTFLKKWVNDKALSLNSYAVAYKIAREGISIPNQFNKGTVISDIINQQRINKLYNNLKNVVIEDIKSDVIKIIK